MTNVHLEISKKVKEKTEAIARYQEMDQKREEIISRLVASYKTNSKVELADLNQWTSKMNDFATANQLPTRELVTNEMLVEYVKKIK